MSIRDSVLKSRPHKKSVAITGTGITDIDNQSFYNLMQTPKDSPIKDM